MRQFNPAITWKLVSCNGDLISPELSPAGMVRNLNETNGQTNLRKKKHRVDPDPPAAAHHLWGTGGYYAHRSHDGYGSAGLLGFIIIVLIVVWLFGGFGTSVYHY
jgi:hypothetical protein